MEKEFDIRKKYRISLLYMLRDLLIAALIGGTIAAVLIDVIGYGFLGATFEMGSFLYYTGIFFAFGAIMGLGCKCLMGGGLAEETGVSIYNAFAATYNSFLFANAGPSYSVGSALSVIMIFVIVLKNIYRLAATAVVLPMTIVYLIIMAILETIFNGLPEGLGNALDKIIPIFAQIAGFAGIVIFLMAINGKL